VEKCNAVPDGNVRKMHLNLTNNRKKKSTYSRAGYLTQPSVSISNNIITEIYFLKLRAHL
jgi:hypothetical protein